MNEKILEKAIEKVAEAILLDPKSEQTINTHYKLAKNTGDDIQMAIFLHILDSSMKEYEYEGQLEDLLQDKYINYIERSLSLDYGTVETRPRRYMDTMPTGNMPEACIILL